MKKLKKYNFVKYQEEFNFYYRISILSIHQVLETLF